MARVRVLVVDDNIQFRWSLMEALSRQGLEIVEEASNGHEGAEKALAVRPDVVLSDLNMPDADGIALIQLLQEKAPEIKVLILTISDQDQNLVSALNSGARGYLLKNENMDMIAKAVDYVAHGGIVISPTMANKLHVDIGGPTPGLGKSADAPETVVEESNDPPPVEIPVAAEDDASLEEETIDSEEPTKAAVGLVEHEPIKEHELVFTAPVEPTLILTLLRELSQETGCEVVRVDASLVGDTVVRVINNIPTQLGKSLAKMPMVTKVTEEPSPAESDEPKRLRLALKPE